MQLQPNSLIPRFGTFYPQVPLCGSVTGSTNEILVIPPGVKEHAVFEPDPTAAECLKTLLELQRSKLLELASRLGRSIGQRFGQIPDQEWQGPARNAFQEQFLKASDSLAQLLLALERAAQQSDRAIETLSLRVR